MDRVSAWADGSGLAVFYLRDGGAEPAFYPKGANYVALDPASGYHCLVDPGKYDPNKARTDLAAMAGWGLNVVRVFLETEWNIAGYGMSAPGIDAATLGNIADFLGAAAANSLRVVLVGGFPGKNYYSLMPTIPGYIDWTNCPILCNGVAQQVTAAWWRDLLGWLKQRGVDFGAIFSCELQNEATVDPTAPPFTRSVGTVEVWGTDYDLSKPADRQQLVDASAVCWANTLAEVIHGIDPELLVGVSTFSPLKVGFSGGFHAGPVGGTGKLYPLRLQSLMQYAEIDYIDLHLYCDAGYPYTAAQELASAELDGGWLSKPLMMGETGVAVDQAAGAAGAASAMRNLMQHTTSAGFAGHLFWTWNTPRVQMPFWSLSDGSNALLRAGIFPALG